MYAGNKCFSISAVRLGPVAKVTERNIAVVFILNRLQGVFNIVYQLAGVGDGDVNGGVCSAYGSPALLCSGSLLNHGTCTCHQEFATGDGCIAGGQADGITEAVFPGFGIAIDPGPFLLGNQLLNLFTCMSSSPMQNANFPWRP